MDFKDTKVAENEKCESYVNSWTQGAEKWAKEWGLDNIKCFFVVQKENPDDKDYVLVRNDEFIYDTKSYEALVCHIDMIALSEGKERSKGVIL